VRAGHEMWLRWLILKHIRKLELWRAGSARCRANMVYRDFTRVGAGKTPDCKDDGNGLGVGGGARGGQAIHQKGGGGVKRASGQRVAAGRRMRVAPRGGDKRHIRPIPSWWAMECGF